MMGKAALVTPVYLSVAWTLMVSYQFFTQKAVSTVVAQVDLLWPLAGQWLVPRIGMIVFVYAFAWVFVLSSVIPSLVLGKERSVLVQFLVCLTLTFAAFFVQDALAAYLNRPVDEMLNSVVVFDNPFIAGAYLAVPYVLMLAIDIQARRKRKKSQKLEEVAEEYLEDAAAEDSQEE